MAKDVIVVVQRDALPNEKENLDILLVSTTGEYPVKVYRDVPSVEAVYGPDGPCPNSKVVRKATTLLNQGKTTLAETLVSKFKIVSFDPPSATPAKAAALTLSFDGDNEITVAAGTTLWVRIGGDDKALVELTSENEITSAEQMAALFSGTTFTKGGKTYSAHSDGTTVAYTATVAGAADTIPQRADFFTDEDLSEAAEITCGVNFTNGRNTLSASDSLIETIKKFQTDVDNDWYYLMADKDDDEYVMALAKFAEASEPSEAELGAGIEDHRKFYMGQTGNKNFACSTARAAVIYTDEKYLNEEPDASYTGNVGPFYPVNVTWKFKRPPGRKRPCERRDKAHFPPAAYGWGTRSTA